MTQPYQLPIVKKKKKNTISQTPFAEQGILWLVAIIPAILLIVAMYIISKYELEDDVIKKINIEIEARHLNNQ